MADYLNIAEYVTVKVLNTFLIMCAVTFVCYFIADYVTKDWGE